MKVIDLFAGVGGMSLGAERAGFHVKCSVEKDSKASDTHKLNFPNTKHFEDDISLLKGNELLRKTRLTSDNLTGVIGGPPCQGFSTIGKRKITDARNDLFYHFFRLVKEMNPSFYVAENVPGILNDKYEDLRNRALSEVTSQFVILPPITVIASDYGAATTRKRIFFIGYNPTKFNEVVNVEDFEPSPDIEKIFVKDALKGLPISISSNWLNEEDGWQPVVKMNGNKFMKNVTNNIPSGVGDKESLKKYLEESKVSGCLGTRHSKEIEKRYGDLELGKQDSISKSVRLKPDGLCPTLRAGTGSDKGSYQAVRPIHYSEPRVITPREAARLQGFPDWFVFHPTKWHSFRQIGNSVSPIVAEYLLKVIAKKLSNPKK